MKKKISVSLLFLLTTHLGTSQLQDTTIIHHQQSDTSLWVLSDGFYVIEDMTIPLSQINDLISAEPGLFTSNNVKQNNNWVLLCNDSLFFSVNRCTFVEATNTRSVINESKIASITFSECIYNENFDASLLSGHISFSRCTFNKSLNIYRCKSIVDVYESSISSIWVSEAKSILINLGQCKSDDRNFKSDISFSTINEFTFSSDYSQNTTMLFNSDTINNFLVSGKTQGSKSLLLKFTKSHINSDIQIPIYVKKSKLIFENCTFEKNCKIDWNCDTIIFSNCFFHESSELCLIDRSYPRYISLVNCNISNLNFSMTDNVILFFPNDLSPDIVFNTFESLLSKYRSEGRLESLKNTDIAYQKYTYGQQGISGEIKNSLALLWWNYGYNKGYIIYWSLFFLLIFFIINSLIWHNMQQLYSIIPLKDQYRLPLESKVKYFFRKQLNIFIYTSFIFFSLKVDFDKLKYRHTGIMIWFFTQYLTGLICIIFIANAILKF